MKCKTGCCLWMVVLLFVTGCATAPRQSEVRIDSAMLSQPNPKAAETLWQQAEKERSTGNIPAAVAIWNRIAQTYPNNGIAAKALYEVGHVYLGQGQPDKALQYLDYLVYHYGAWEGINAARLDQMRAWSMVGRNKQVQKEARSLWDTSGGQPAVQVGLSELVAGTYAREGDMDTALEWLSTGFSVARTPEEKKKLAQATMNILQAQNEDGMKRLYKKNYNDFMRVFFDFRMLQLEMQRAASDSVRDKMRGLLERNPSHPVADEIRAALRGAVVEKEYAVNPGRIGALVPVNGPYAKYGEAVLRGLNLASNEWNQNHPSDSISLVVKDIQSEPDKAAKSLTSLVQQDNVLAVVGPLGSQAVKAGTPVANKLGVPMLALTQKEDDDSTDNTYALHVFVDNKDLVASLVRHCKDRLGFKRFAVLYPEDRYGQKMAKAFSEVVPELGGELMAGVSYKSKTTDFKEPILKLLDLASKNPSSVGVEGSPFDALFIPDQVAALSMIAPQLPYNNVVGVTLMGTNLWAEGPLVQSGGVYVEQALFATPFHADSSSPKSRLFKEKYQAAYNAAPSYLEAQAYDALMLLLEARSGMRTNAGGRMELLQNLLQIHQFEGVTGTSSFGADGTLHMDYQIFQVLNGELSQVGP